MRPAHAGDVDGIARAHVGAWRAAFTFLPAAFLDLMTVDVVRAKWASDVANQATPMFVADGDGVEGFLQLRPDALVGEVMSLYVDPAAWSRGVGSRLLSFGEAWLAERAGTAMLWTARDSEQSRSFYEHRGWAATGREQEQALGPNGVALHEVEYRKALP